MLDDIELHACDREPIHAPDAIQPHGALLIADPASHRIVAGAGFIETFLGVDDWIGRSLTDLLGSDIVAQLGEAERPRASYVGALTAASGEMFDVSAHLSDGWRVVELEPAAKARLDPGVALNELETVAADFEHASDLEELAHRAAGVFRRVTGFDRVMIYRFLDDDSGQVIAEDRRADLRSFMNHRFPAADIPRQARALYLRNPIRVIVDIDYEPAPIRRGYIGDAPIDMSDAALRSVSPIHIQYLRNMRVQASASVSIVKDGGLWGLVACHHESPRGLSWDERAMTRALAGALGRQIRAKDDSDAFRQRVRLRSFQDEFLALVSRESSLEDAVFEHVDGIRLSLDGDGAAVVLGDKIVSCGRCPPTERMRALATWALTRGVDAVFATDRLASAFPEAAEWGSPSAGLMSIVLSASQPWLIMWFRTEEIETVEWAGNPHKGAGAGQNAALEPRSSFESWCETVRGRSRPWTLPEIEAAGQMKTAMVDLWQGRRLRELNRKLVAVIDEKDQLIQQKEFLIGEVNHRVQNSLQLVSSFLALQARGSDQPGLADELEEARRRITAVALVHRRLYRSDQVENVDAARYVEELVGEVASSLGEAWAQRLSLDAAPVLLPTDRAISIGLVLTELLINATKYAYRGEPGPISVMLHAERSRIRLVVADRGVGKASGPVKTGFGSRMIEALARQLDGKLAYEDNRPGLRAVFAAPIVRASS